MSLTSLIQYIQDSSLTNELFNRLNRKDNLKILSNTRTTRSLISTALAKHSNKNLLVIVPTLEEASHLPLLFADLNTWPYDYDLIIEFS